MRFIRLKIFRLLTVTNCLNLLKHVDCFSRYSACEGHGLGCFPKEWAIGWQTLSLKISEIYMITLLCLAKKNMNNTLKFPILTIKTTYRLNTKKNE